MCIVTYSESLSAEIVVLGCFSLPKDRTLDFLLKQYKNTLGFKIHLKCLKLILKVYGPIWVETRLRIVFLVELGSFSHADMVLGANTAC